MGSSAFENSIILLCYLCIERYIWTCRKLRNSPAGLLSDILKIHGIAPEYKYYAIFLE